MGEFIRDGGAWVLIGAGIAIVSAALLPAGGELPGYGIILGTSWAIIGSTWILRNRTTI